ncbi:MAG: hypothetical protein IKT01_02590 [Eubacteriaceae bacterium]|nr:hypothetical protein [Eubacteriaceae bacterium]
MKQKQNMPVIPDPNEPSSYSKTIMVSLIFSIIGPIVALLSAVYITGKWRFPALLAGCFMGYNGISEFASALTRQIIAKKNKAKEGK